MLPGPISPFPFLFKHLVEMSAIVGTCESISCCLVAKLSVCFDQSFLTIGDFQMRSQVVSLTDHSPEAKEHYSSADRYHLEEKMLLFDFRS